MNPFKTLLLITLTLGFTACSDKDKSRGTDSITNNTNVNTIVPANGTTSTQTPTPPIIDPNTPSTYKSLNLTAEQTTLNKDDNTTLKLLATSSDGTSKELNTDIEYIITPNGSAEVNNNTLTAKQDGTLTLQAKTGNTLSNALTLTVAWTVNGYTLPPEPDKTVNEATLGGIDSNSNGVRDDVERKIYEKYPVSLQRELMIDGAQYFQKIMTEPTSEARKLKKEGTRVGDCALYLMDYDSEINSDNFNRITFLENYTVNNKIRVRKYLDYNLALSGGVYGSSPSDWNKDACSEAVRKVLTEMGK